MPSAGQLAGRRPAECTFVGLLRGGELDGERVLRPQTVELALTDHLQGAPLPADGTHSAVPELSNDVPALPFKQGFGLGFA
jgi:methyl acetate hydrolase